MTVVDVMFLTGLNRGAIMRRLRRIIDSNSGENDAEQPGAVLSTRQRKRAELEVVSNEARLRLTRLLRAGSRTRESTITLINQNAIINLANTVLNRPIYRLEADDWGDYHAAEYAWHHGELELILRRPNTVQLVEILADLISQNWLDSEDVNAILASDRCGIEFSSDDSGRVTVDVKQLPLIDDRAKPDESANIRQLFDRMDRAMEAKDWSLVLHTGASAFETLAKLVVGTPNVQNQSLGGFFAAFRKHSVLAVPLLDAIEAIYKRRNIEPLAGHGSTANPSVTEQEAIQIYHLTKTLVLLERELSSTPVRVPAPGKSPPGPPRKGKPPARRS